MKRSKITAAILILSMLMTSAAMSSCSMDLSDLFGGSPRSERDRDDDDEDEDDREDDGESTSESEETEETDELLPTDYPSPTPATGDSSESTESDSSDAVPDDTEPSSDVTVETSAWPAPGNRLLDEIMPSSSTDYLDVCLDYANSSDIIRFDPYTSEMYPELASGIEQYNETVEEAGMQNAFRTITIRRADNKVFSFLNVLQNSDEVMNMWGINYDVATGRQLSISDVIADSPAFSEAAGLIGDNGNQMLTWLVEPYGVTWIMDPMGDEPQFHTVLYRGNEDLFTDYFEPCDSYFLNLSDRGTNDYTIDIGNNGTPDQIGFECVYDEYGLIMSFDVIVNGVHTRYSGDGYFEGFGLQYSILCLDGDCYAYVEIDVPSDYSETYVFALSEDGATYVDMFEGSISGIPMEIDNPYQSDINPASTWVTGCEPTNPGALYQRERVYLLGTYGVLYLCDIADNGMPERCMGWGYVCGCPTLTTLTGFETVGHQSDSDITVDEGTQLRLVMCNSEPDSVMAMGPDNVGFVYITEDISDYPHIVLGPDLPEDEVFGNIQYAS